MVGSGWDSATVPAHTQQVSPQPQELRTYILTELYILCPRNKYLSTEGSA